MSLLLLQTRDISHFPPGDNATDTLIANHHFNLTTLLRNNYTLYSNSTLSNASDCHLLFPPYVPALLPNGTFLNATSCYSPINPIRARGILGLCCAVLFAGTILFTLVNLRKHGRRFLPREKRWRTVGRRWQWYWCLFVAAVGIVSGVASVDVDRTYVLSTAIVLQSFFYCLMLPGILAVAWESVRHWGSWQERRLYNADPFSLPQDPHSRRGRAEFSMPLIFYLFILLNVFMTIPRSWTPIQKQRSPDQQSRLAEPSATDLRFKAGAVFACCAYLVISYSLGHSLHYYKLRSQGLLRSCWSMLHYTPLKFAIILPLVALKVSYAVLSAWSFDVSPLRYDVRLGWLYGLGYAPVCLVILVLNIWGGYLEPNEDRVLLKERAERTTAIDAELGINRAASRKPGWWSKVKGEQGLSAGEQERQLAMSGPQSGGGEGDIGGGIATHRKLERAIEMGSLPVGSQHYRGGGGGDEEQGQAEKKREEEEQSVEKEEDSSTRMKWTEMESVEERERRELMAEARRARPPQVVRSLIPDLE